MPFFFMCDSMRSRSLPERLSRSPTLAIPSSESSLATSGSTPALDQAFAPATTPATEPSVPAASFDFQPANFDQSHAIPFFFMCDSMRSRSLPERLSRSPTLAIPSSESSLATSGSTPALDQAFAPATTPATEPSVPAASFDFQPANFDQSHAIPFFFMCDSMRSRSLPERFSNSPTLAIPSSDSSFATSGSTPAVDQSFAPATELPKRELVKPATPAATPAPAPATAAPELAAAAEAASVAAACAVFKPPKSFQSNFAPS